MVSAQEQQAVSFWAGSDYGRGFFFPPREVLAEQRGKFVLLTFAAESLRCFRWEISDIHRGKLSLKAFTVGLFGTDQLLLGCDKSGK